MTDMIPETMKAMVTMGHGDFDMLVWHEDWPVPTAASGEVLIRVGACGLNNTDINTRTARHSGTALNANCRGRTIPPWDRHYENETTSSCPVIADKPMIADKTVNSLIFLTGGGVTTHQPEERYASR